jgi:hypothetical protein
LRADYQTFMAMLGPECESLMSRIAEAELEAATKDEDYKISLGSLATFAKIYIWGGFLDGEARHN